METWAWLSIISAVLFGLGDYIVVFSEQSRMNIITLYATYTILIGLVSFIYLVWFRKNGVKDVLAFRGKEWMIVAGLSLMYFFAYILHFIAIQIATNPGYANALVMFHVLVLTMLSYFFLSKPLSMKSLAGILLMFIGAYYVIQGQ